MTSLENQEWNRNVWKLSLIEITLENRFKDGIIKKDEYKKNKKVIDSIWVRIFDFHPDQHPLSKEIFKLNFSDDEQTTHNSRFREVERKMTYEKNKHGDRILIKGLIDRIVGAIYYIDGQGDIRVVGLTKESRRAIKKITTQIENSTQFKGEVK